MNEPRSARINRVLSSGVKGAFIGLVIRLSSQPPQQTQHHLLIVLVADGALGPCPLSGFLQLPLYGQDDGDDSRVAIHRLVDQLLGPRLALGDAFAPTVLGDGEVRSQLTLDQRRQVLRASATASGVARLALLK